MSDGTGERGITGLVLVHGGAHGAWCWQPTMEHLRTPSLAVDLPGRDGRSTSFADMATTIVSAIHHAGWERAILVGHSMGGVPVVEAARMRPELVTRIVLVSAAVPPEGKTIADTLAAPLRLIVRQQALLARRDPTRPARGALPAPIARWLFCNDMDDEQTAFVLDNLGPEDPTLVLEPVTRVGLDPSIPRTYVRLRRDRSITPRRQARMMSNLGGADEVWLDAGHDVMISAPTELAAMLDDLASR